MSTEQSMRPDNILLRFFDRRLAERGDTPEGAYWPNQHDRLTRFDVMLDVIRCPPGTPTVLCDLGCGTGELLGHIRRRGLRDITYIGIDRSTAALDLARAKFPDATFIALDVNAPDAVLEPIACDYLVANGLFTAKFDLSQQQMWEFLIATIGRVWPQVRRGLAFNVMSKVVDWERDDLFHLPMDDAARLLHGLAGRHVRMRADYGLYEYTAYAYRPARADPPAGGRADAAPSPLTAPATDPVAVLRPLLPPSARLLPYLRRIDAARRYTNHGQLTVELETRLGGMLGLPEGGVACASSGSAALVGAILAAAGRATPARPLALVPAFTFVATALAVEQCGYQPYLVDVDPTSWMLDPARLAGLDVIGRTGIVVPVAPYGRPVPQAPWLAFRDRTGIAVVIDGAASFDRVADAPGGHVGTLPLMLSFHATKSFAAAEAGAVVATDPDLVARAVQALNFGFLTARDALMPGINGKMSEYHAAVGLAECDGWPAKHAALNAVIDAYRRQMDRAGIGDRFIAAPAIGLGYALWRCRDAGEAARKQAALDRNGIDWRLWYGTGLQAQTHFARHPAEALGVTAATAPCLLGLPMAPDLTDRQIGRVVAALTAP
jgi:dTDP-4-amino-4,6-dideoxygalactose transaminase